MFHNLLEYLQPIELGIAHRDVSLHGRTCKMAQKWTFLLGAMETSLYSLYTRTSYNNDYVKLHVSKRFAWALMRSVASQICWHPATPSMYSCGNVGQFE
jgi:hypothetical protein